MQLLALSGREVGPPIATGVSAFTCLMTSDVAERQLPAEAAQVVDDAPDLEPDISVGAPGMLRPAPALSEAVA